VRACYEQTPEWFIIVQTKQIYMPYIFYVNNYLSIQNSGKIYLPLKEEALSHNNQQHIENIRFLHFIFVNKDMKSNTIVKVITINLHCRITNKSQSLL
jgi:hypothetical protein